MAPSEQQPAVRRYDRTTRQAAADANRGRVLEVARGLLLRQGYRTTTIKQIAAAAGVSTEMIYQAFGSKRGLVKRLHDVTIAGDDELVPLGDRALIRHALAAATMDAALQPYTDFVATYHGRAGGLATLLGEADPEVASVLAETEQERLRGVTAFLERLVDNGLVASAADGVADGLWTLTSPAVYRQLVDQRGWSVDAYRQWLCRMMTATLS